MAQGKKGKKKNVIKPHEYIIFGAGIILAVAVAVYSGFYAGTDGELAKAVRIRIENRVYQATIYGSPAGKELKKLLPVSATAENRGTSICFPIKLNITGTATDFIKPVPGELLYDPEIRKLCIVGADAFLSGGYIRLGKLDDDRINLSLYSPDPSIHIE